MVITETQFYIGSFAAAFSITATILFWNSQQYVDSIGYDGLSILSAYASWFAVASWALWLIFIIMVIVHAVQSRK